MFGILACSSLKENVWHLGSNFSARYSESTLGLKIQLKTNDRIEDQHIFLVLLLLSTLSRNITERDVIANNQQMVNTK